LLPTSQDTFKWINMIARTVNMQYHPPPALAIHIPALASQYCPKQLVYVLSVDLVTALAILLKFQDELTAR
jgi:hypothetical protein